MGVGHGGFGAGARAISPRFGSVTVLNGHIHQLMQKVEGNVTFHTARSTAFPQPAPGTAPAPGPKLVPAGELRKWLGVAEVAYTADADRARRHRQRPLLDEGLDDAESVSALALAAACLAAAPASAAGDPDRGEKVYEACQTAIRSTRTTSGRAIAGCSAARPARSRTTTIPTRSNRPISSGTRRRSTSG